MEKKVILYSIYFVALFLLIFFVGSIGLVTSFYGDINMIDEGQVGAWVSHMLHGKVPYRDFFVPYGPLYVFPVYIFSSFVGPSAFLIRFFVLTLYTFISLLLILPMLNSLNLSRIARIVVVLLLVFLPGVNIRHFFGLFAVYFVFLSIGKANYWYSFFAGLFLCLSFLISAEVGIVSMLFSLVIYLASFIGNTDWKQLVQKIVVSLFGFFLLALPFGFLAFSQGWLLSYLSTTVDVLVSFSGIALPNGQNFPNPLQLIPQSFDLVSLLRFLFSKEMLLYWALLFYLCPLLYCIVRLVLLSFDRKTILLSILVCFGITEYFNLIGRTGHFFLVVPILIIIGVYFFELLLPKIVYRKSFLFEKAVVAVILGVQLLFLVRLISIYRYNVVHAPALLSALFVEKNNPPFVGPIVISDKQNAQIMSVQQFVWSKTTSTESVYFFSDEAMMYFLTNRINPTRYDLPFVANTLEKRYEVLSDLKRHEPRYVLQNNTAWAVDGVSNSQRLPEIISYIKRNYRADTSSLPGYTVYIRK